ncbi:hypothetical protein IWW56_000024 [Coemansia sp. RSA 2131]|nr:hypothetical protein IWW56_000024 [Coemansia sp. RSA 2131]
MSASVVSKYANLPDIDTEQPDVYETPDAVVEEVGIEDDEVPLSEDISTDTVPTDTAAARFRASAGDVDGKSLMTRYQRSLLRTLQLESLPGDIEAVASAQLVETAEQRLRRLVYETQELRAQVARENATEGKQPRVALMHLVNGLHDELAQLSIEAEQPVVEKAQGVEPQTKHMVSDVPDVEKRVAGLEKLVGAGQSGHSLVNTVGRLRQQMDVLSDPQRVDGIQRRIKQVLLDMDQLEQAHKTMAKVADTADAGRLDPRSIKRIDEVYEKLANVDALVELAPATARRLQTLARLHADASGVVARVARVQGEQECVGEEMKAMREVAEGLMSSVRENEVTLKTNVSHLDARIAALSDRLAALSK